MHWNRICLAFKYVHSRANTQIPHYPHELAHRLVNFGLSKGRVGSGRVPTQRQALDGGE
jgi:hypothetical protein